MKGIEEEVPEKQDNQSYSHHNYQPHHHHHHREKHHQHQEEEQLDTASKRRQMYAVAGDRSPLWTTLTHAQTITEFIES